MVHVCVRRGTSAKNVSTSVHILVRLQVWAQIKRNVIPLQVNVHIVKQAISVGFVKISVAIAATKTNAMRKMVTVPWAAR